MQKRSKRFCTGWRTGMELRSAFAGTMGMTTLALLLAGINVPVLASKGHAPNKKGALPAEPKKDGEARASKFWAYITPKRPNLPTVKNSAWAKTPIDRFVLAMLESKGLKPAPPADRRTLIRRATFDLTGLPPTPDEIHAFLADARPDAYARVIDRLLASPAYGERWGRHWLDVARYADSNGVDENLVYANAWRYRDYVIRAFNQDKPIDRFFQEQLAGDLLPAITKEQTKEQMDEQSNLDRVIATGYLSLGPKMLAEDDPVKQEEDIIDEQIDTMGKTFMGMTLGCARCHDHKFDPFPQTDYYALAGIFKSTRTMMNFKNMAEWQEIALVPKAEQEKQAAIDKAIREKRQLRDRKRDAAEEALVKEAQDKQALYLKAAQEQVAEEARRKNSPYAELKPVIVNTAGKPDIAPPVGSVVTEAEDFVTGNVLKDRDGFGKGIGVLVNAGQYPNVTEYDVMIKEGEAGPHQLDLRYASGDPRPIRIYVNGFLVNSNAAGKVTGGFYPDAQRWFAEGLVALKAGKNRIRFERDSYFPHIDKFLLIARPGATIPRTPEQIAAEAGLHPEFLQQAVEQLREQSKKPDSKVEITFTTPATVMPLFPAALREELKQLEAEIAQLEKGRPKLPKAMAVSEGKPVTMKVHLRGNYLTLGNECTRHFPVVLAGDRQPIINSMQSGRLELAQWLTRAEHPLTSRVFVNRVWRWHFGRGIVSSPDNFGTLGERPSHPLLLDWLATYFTDASPTGAKWSLKQLHRTIMLSNTYQQSSRYNADAARIDPENRLYWRHSRLRLEAEAIRDNMLAVSGQLDTMQGGSLLNFGERQYVTSTANADPVNYTSNRRSVYLPVIRSALYDVYTAFDFGDPTVMNGDRATTTVAPQALFMMNSTIALEQTRKFAERLLSHTEITDTARVQLAYETCFGRPASDAEVARALRFLQQMETGYQAEAKSDSKSDSKSDQKMRPGNSKVPARVLAWQSLCKALYAANEFIFVD